MHDLFSLLTLITLVALATTIFVHPTGVKAFLAGITSFFTGSLKAAQGK